MTPRALLAAADREIAETERVLKIAQVARMANVSPRTVWRDIKRGLLTVERQRIEKRHRIRVALSHAKSYARARSVA